MLVATRAHEMYAKYMAMGIDGQAPLKKSYRAAGAGRKQVAPEVREAALEWFIDIRASLKGRLSRKNRQAGQLFEKLEQLDFSL